MNTQKRVVVMTTNNTPVTLDVVRAENNSNVVIWNGAEIHIPFKACLDYEKAVQPVTDTFKP